MRTYKVSGKKGLRWGVDYVDDRGRRVRKVVADTRKKAEAYLARVRVDLERGTYHDAGRYSLTVGELVGVAKTKRVRTLDAQLVMLRRLVAMLGADRPVSSLKLQDWEAVRDELERTGAAKPATRNCYLSALHSTIRLALRRGRLGRDPLEHVRPERMDNIRNRTASTDEEARLWAACGKQADRTLLALSLYTAARRGEIHKAQFEHFDLDGATWWLPHTKSGKPRTLPLPEVAITEVRRLRDERRARGCDRLFPGVDVGALGARFRRLRNRAGLENIGLHDLRRTAATRAVVAGVPLPTVMSVLGHSNLASTARYLAITAEHSRPFAEAMPARPPEIPPDDTA